MKCDYCGQESSADVCERCLWKVNPEEAAYQEAKELGLYGSDATEYVEQELREIEGSNKNESSH